MATKHIQLSVNLRSSVGKCQHRMAALMIFSVKRFVLLSENMRKRSCVWSDFQVACFLGLVPIPRASFVLFSDPPLRLFLFFCAFHCAPLLPPSLDLWCEPEAEAWDVSQSVSTSPPDGSGVGSNPGRYRVRRRVHEACPNRINQPLVCECVCVCVRVCVLYVCTRARVCVYTARPCGGKHTGLVGWMDGRGGAVCTSAHVCMDGFAWCV